MSRKPEYHTGRMLPRYDLYGEQPLQSQLGVLHCESIAARSQIFNWEISAHLHEAFLQIIYVRRGSGVALLNDASETIAGPCVLLVPAGRTHGFNFSRDIDGLVFTATQNEVEAWPVLHAAGLDLRVAPATRLIIKGARQRARFDQLFMLLAEEIASSAPLHLSAAQSLLSLVLIELHRTLDAVAVTHARSPRGAQRIRQFLGLVDTHFRTQRSIGYYAAKLGITPTQLSRQTRDQLGFTPLQVIQARLLREAQRELIYTSLSIKAIASELGFEDAAYFSRSFQAQTGQSPRAFREAMVPQSLKASRAAPA